MAKLSFSNLFKKKSGISDFSKRPKRFGFKSMITVSLISGMLSSYVIDLLSNKNGKIDISNLNQVKIALKKEETKVNQYLKSADDKLKNGRFAEAKNILENVRFMLEPMEKLAPDSVSFKEEIDSLKIDIDFLNGFISELAILSEHETIFSTLLEDIMTNARTNNYLVDTNLNPMKGRLQSIIENSTNILNIIREFEGNKTIQEQAYAQWKAYLSDLIETLDSLFVIFNDFEKKYPESGGNACVNALQHEYKILKGLFNSRL